VERILRKNGMLSGQAGFTLVELLVVITIIGLLVGLVSVAVPKAIESGMKAKAKGELTAIVAAVKAYKQEYGRWPVNLPNGVDDEDTEASGTYAWCDGDKSKTLMKILCASPQDTSGLNPKGVRFLEGPAQDGTFVDPWNTQLIVKLDTNDSNSIEYYGAGNKPNISLSVIALSFGPLVNGKTFQLNPDDPKCKNIFSWR
jgi:prepilin-type N-terminal cleavage/methylation domain-containing protein